MTAKKKIGLLVNNSWVDSYIYDFIVWAKHQPDLDVSHCLLIGDVKPVQKGRWTRLADEILQTGFLLTLRKRINGILFAILYRLEARSLKRLGLHDAFFEKKDALNLVERSLSLSPNISKSGFVYRFNAADIEKIEEQKFDILLRFCNGILKGDILGAAKHGIISFHHGDNQVNRGGPAGFWEVYHRQPTTGFMIQRLSEELDGGDILFRGWAQTQRGWLLNQAHLFSVSYYYLRGVIEKSAGDGSVKIQEPNFPYSYPLYRTPTSMQIVKYLTDRYWGILSSHINTLLKKKHRWGVAYGAGDWRSAVLHKGVVIKAPAGHFIADPFVIEHGGSDYVFVEDLDFATHKGAITVYEINKDSFKLVGTALEEPFHLSFPYLFKYKGELYMCPETGETRDIHLYKCVDFPLKWELANVLLKDISATDTMIFEKDGLWWLFTNDDPTGTNDHGLQLSIYYSENPLTNSWQPHRMNPIYVDSRRARNGGLLTEGNQLYRVNQRQGFGIYGRAAQINKICELTKDSYREEIVGDIEPEFKTGINATHHMHSNSRYTVFDFCRWENPYRD